MLCQTVKSGMECSFMSKKGCGYFGNICRPVVDKCGDCGKVIEYESAKYCQVYPEPASKWLNGKCPTATHIKIEINENSQKINPLKASKRSSKK